MHAYGNAYLSGTAERGGKLAPLLLVRAQMTHSNTNGAGVNVPHRADIPCVKECPKISDAVSEVEREHDVTWKVPRDSRPSV